MSIKKRISSVLVVSLLGAFILNASAFKDDTAIHHQDAINRCVELGIIQGRDDGTVDPTATVTRAEMAKMICYIYNGGKDFSSQNSEFQLADKPTFSDSKQHWAEKYIEYCQSLRIINGMGDGTFAPDATVTGTQAAKILLAVLGYDVSYEGMFGADWGINTTVLASKHNLYEGISTLDPSIALTRERAAQMFSNVLAQRMINYEVIINAPAPPVGVVEKSSIPVQGFYTLKEVYFDGKGNPNDIGVAFERGESYSFHAYTGELTDSYQGKEAPAGKTFLVAPLTARALVDADKKAKVLLKDFELFIAIPGEVERQTFLPKASWQQTMMPESFTLQPKESFTYDLVFEVPHGSSDSTLVFVQKNASGVPSDYGKVIHITD